MRPSLVFVFSGAVICLQSPALNSLARDVERLEAIREVKDATATFAQLAQFGRWNNMTAMFTEDGILQWDKTIVKKPKIESWLKTDAAGMDGINPGSLDTMVAATPLINLAVDGRTAKARFNGWRFQGDGAGNTRIQGGIYENQYALVDGRWKISLLRYYALYNGTYANGWRNAGGGYVDEVPFHYTTDESGVPIPPPVGIAPETKATVEELAHRITRLNDEDEVRNVQHAYGYYVDRRMWTDVVDLFHTEGTFKVDYAAVGAFSGQQGIRQGLERWMGREGLSQGILNEHLIFDTVVRVDPSGQQAFSHGVEIGLIGDANKTAGQWQFNIFHNRFTKEDGIWKLKDVSISPLIVAQHSTGWGRGSIIPQSTTVPDVLDYTRSTGDLKADGSNTDIADLQRRLARSAAYDGAENASNAYGFYIDFIDGAGCGKMAAIHAREGHKESPFAGFWQTRERVLKACTQYYGTGATVDRSSISFHARPQPVIIVSQDGRSAGLRARLFQPTTEKNSAGVMRGAIYQDQMILEDGIWRLWSVTIDEFYWTSSSWKDGWPGVKPRAKDAPNPAPRDLIKQYPPDITLVEMGDPRETGFQGGSGRFTTWPEIQRMWFAYRNPVTGRVPDSYWPGCVPCQHKPAWSLTRHGYQEPPTGPTILTVTQAPASGGRISSVTISVAAGPGEVVEGTLRIESEELKGEQVLTAKTGSDVVVLLPESLSKGSHIITARFLGSNRLKPGEKTFTVVLS